MKAARAKSSCALAWISRYEDRKRHITNFDLRSPCIANSTLSRTVSLGNRLVIWKVRAIPNAVRRWLGQRVTSWPNSRICPDVAGNIPVIRLNSVVLPAPFGPMMALRSPGMIFSVTPRTACSPPKLFDSRLSSRTGCPPFVGVSEVTLMSRFSQGLGGRGSWRNPSSIATLIAELAGRVVAAVDGRLQELVLVELTELSDIRVGLDDGVPELILVVPE